MPQKKPYIGKVFKEVIDAYRRTEEFRTLKPNSKLLYERILRMATIPNGIGSTPCEEMRPAVVQMFLDAFRHSPSTRAKALTVMKVIEDYGVVRELLPGTITFGCKPNYKGGGHRPWDDEEFAFAQANASPHMSQAITLGLHTGQRGGDLIRMRWTDIVERKGYPGIKVEQEKTGVKIWIPFTRELIRIMASWQRQPGFILRKYNGEPFEQRSQLTDAWGRERKAMTNLKGCTLHGLRASAVIRLRRAGCSIPHITDFVGMSEGMVTRYCRFGDKIENALAAVELLEARAEVIHFPGGNRTETSTG